MEHDSRSGSPVNDQAATRHAALSSFLAVHDAACPKCRFNLRGLQGPVCPECGAKLFLYVGSPSPRNLVYQSGLALVAAGAGFCVVVVLVMVLQTGWRALAGWRRVTLDFDADHGLAVVVLLPVWLVMLLLWIRNAGRICGSGPALGGALCGGVALLLLGMAFLMSALG